VVEVEFYHDQTPRYGDSEVPNHSTTPKLISKSLTFLGFSKYKLRNDATLLRWVKKKAEWKKLAPDKNSKQKYIRTTLKHDNKHWTISLHRLMLLVFIGPPPKGKEEACHKDDNPRNNCLSNLYWGSHDDNEDDKVRNGRKVRGESVGTAKINQFTARLIKKAKGKMSSSKASVLFGVSKTQIKRIWNQESWAWA
jgi:hypothetical protein